MTRERGSASLLSVACVAIVLVLTGMVVDAGRLMTLRTTAQTAADAAALAAAPATFVWLGGAAAPEAEAATFAEANGARLVSCACPPDPAWRARTVTVRVAVDAVTGPLRVGSVEAVAAAEFDPTVWLTGGR